MTSFVHTGARFLSNVFTFIAVMFLVETNLLTWLLVSNAYAVTSLLL